MTAGLRACVLGPVQVERDGSPVDLGGRRQRTVLGRLVVAAGRPVSADRLLSDVWGEAPALSALHVSISNLRRALEPHRPARGPSVLASRPGGYALAVPSDADQLAADVGRSVELLAAGRLAAAREAAGGALGLWRGRPYDDLDEQAWLVHERARLAGLRLVAAEQLGEVLLREGAAVQAALALEPLVDGHPGRERLCVLLAVALYRQHRQDEALALLGRTRRHLADALGLDPGPELRQVEAAVLAQEPDPLAPVPAVGPSAPGLPAAVPADPLVGRDRPRAVLSAAAARALSGTPTYAVLVGEAGIGKTRVARDLADVLAQQAWHVVWGATTEAAGAPALWPWVGVLRQLADVLACPDALRPLLDGAADPDATADPAAARWRQQQAVAAYLAAASEIQPVLVVLDDLHWADPASQALLAELLGSLHRGRLLVVAATRPAGPPGLTHVLARLARAGALRLDLEGLAEDEVRVLAAASGLAVDARALLARTGGNPFLVHETLALAAQTGASPLDVVPASVTDVVRARTALLPGDGAAVLAAAAVLGTSIDPAVLAEVLQAEPAAVETTLDAAVEADLLVPGPDAALRFRHDLVRETCYAGLAPVRRARLHGRAHDVLLAARRAAPAELAVHALAAGSRLAPAAVDWCTAAGQADAARSAHASALRWWQRAAEADHRAGSDPPRQVRVLLGLVGAHLDAGDAVGALESRTAAVRAARRAGDPGLLAAALTALDRPLFWSLRPHGTVALDLVAELERSLAGWPVEPSAQRCALLATLAMELYGSEQDPRCDTLSAAALDLAEQLDRTDLLAFALNARQIAIAFPGRERERAELAERLAALGAATGRPTVELAGRQLAAQARLQLFEVTAADAHAAAARRLAVELGLPLPSLQLRLWDSSRALLDGDLGAALTLLDEVDSFDWPWWGRDAMLATVRLTLLLRAGAYDRLDPLLATAAHVHPTLGTDARALGLLASGHRREAEALLATAPTDVPRDWAWRAAACVRAQAALALGSPEALTAAYARLLPEAGRIAAAGSIDAGPVDRHLAELAAALGLHREASEHRARLAALCAREHLSTPL